MPISSQTVPNWSALERKILEGGYELDQCLNPSEVAARFKVRILGDRFTEAIADVFAPGATPRAQVALWLETAGFDHPNINRPLSAGEISVDGGLWPYFVRKRPDETLGTVLAERALNIEETREVARSVTSALEYLHENGYVHGSISPEQVLAIGDFIQVSTLYLRRANVPIGATRAGVRFRAPESPLENTTPEADVYCFGCALFEMLTGKKITADSPADPAELPQPFAYIVDRSLEPDPDKRLSLPALRALLEGRQIAQVTATPEAEIHDLSVDPVETSPNGANGRALSEEAAAETSEKTREEHVVAAASPSLVTIRPAPPVLNESEPGKPNATNFRAVPRPASTEAASSVASAQDRIRARREAAERSYTRPQPTEGKRTSNELSASKPWMWVVLAAVLLGGALWLARPKAATRPQVASVNQTAITPQNEVSPNDLTKPASTAPVGGASHAVGPDGANPAHPAPAAIADKPLGHGALADEKVWRVVVWTFSRQADAEKRVTLVKHKHADLHPEVFLPHGKGTAYLVTLGGQMTRPEAERLRQKARAAGLPRDAYVQNYQR